MSIIVPACLAKCFPIIYEAQIVLILLAGDVERNPGPEGKQFLLEMRSALQASIDKVSSTQSTMEESIKIIFAELNDSLKVLTQHTEQINQLKSEVSFVKKMITEQQQKMDDFEDRSRCRNLVIFGLPEMEGETPGRLKRLVLEDIFRTKLGVGVQSVDRLHRIGVKRTNKTRPVMLIFFYYNEKMHVLQSCPRLKGSNITISHDYCLATLNKRSNLWQHGKEFKSKDRKVTLDYDRLRVDDAVYIWDEVNSCPKQVHPTNFRQKQVRQSNSAQASS